MDCMECSSVWLSAVAAPLVADGTLAVTFMWLALSAGAMFLEAVYELLWRKSTGA
jgi:hypothetical protein